MDAETRKKYFSKAPKKDYDKLVKDFECAKCTKWLDCKGKIRNSQCINFEERKQNK